MKIKTILAEKDTAIVLWKEVLALAKEIKFKDQETQSYVAVSAEYALHLYGIYRAVYNLAAIKQGLADASAKAKWLKVYDAEWAAFEKLKKEHLDCATLYSRDKALRMPVVAADEIIKTMR